MEKDGKERLQRNIRKLWGVIDSLHWVWLYIHIDPNMSKLVKLYILNICSLFQLYLNKRMFWKVLWLSVWPTIKSLTCIKLLREKIWLRWWLSLSSIPLPLYQEKEKGNLFIFIYLFFRKRVFRKQQKKKNVPDLLILSPRELWLWLQYRIKDNHILRTLVRFYKFTF